MLLLMMFVIAVLYRFGPYRRSPRWEWVSVGTVVATLLWLLGSGGLSLYVSQVANMDELYGSLGAVVVLMLWFWLSSFVVLLGAELNAEMERQTRHDTTIGKPRPMGEREAYAADTLGSKRPWQKDERRQGEDP
ncbi:YihY/virulence factor BrkB family protein [Billgrantia sp. Q4P2]|uniref:YihY/virulence factor BrkB family protein n=1 Tax=Billgrantia sp. Q4P2 TaxID=3463857 RepID=UPI0040560343